jgi:hypothetical protein
MSATEQNYGARDRIRAAVKLWIVATSGTASVVLGAFVLTRPY